MASRSITCLNQAQRTWIKDAIEDIQESPEAYGLSSKKDSAIVDIVIEDFESVFEGIFERNKLQSFIQTVLKVNLD